MPDIYSSGPILLPGGVVSGPSSPHPVAPPTTANYGIKHIFIETRQGLIQGTGLVQEGRDGHVVATPPKSGPQPLAPNHQSSL